MTEIDATEAKVWDAGDITITVGGVEVNAYNSFVYEGDEDEASHIECTKGTAGFQYKGPKPKGTLKVKSVCSALPRMYEIRDGKEQVPVTYQSPVKVVNLVSSIISSIKDGEDAGGAPETTIEFLAMKIETRRK